MKRYKWFSPILIFIITIACCPFPVIISTDTVYESSQNKITLSRGIYLGFDWMFGSEILVVSVSDSNQPTIDLVDFDCNGTLDIILTEGQSYSVDNQNDNLDYSWRNILSNLMYYQTKS